MSDFTYDVFISYSHRDAEWVRDWLLPRLKSEGLRVRIDSDFDVGTPSIVNMENAVKHSRKTILVMTPNWTLSEWTDFESILTQTRDPAGRKRRVVPILLKACELPDRIDILTRADFTDPTRWVAELVRVLEALRESPTATPSRESNAALPPNLVHPYPMQANFTGRVDERRELTAWLADDTRPICALVAMGGMGKSALAWYWLTHDLLPPAQPAAAPTLDGVMWWSFYEGESSFAKFIDDAFKYVTNHPTIDADRFPTTYDRAQELRRLLQTKRVLFILDGFERQLRAYARLDAAYQPDDATNLSHDARDCVDPTAARWLKDIAAVTTRAKVLLTTRLMPHDLEDRAGDALAGVLNRELKQLSPDDALTFMRAQGMSKGTRAEITDACAIYGYHPLSLRLLSGLMARDARTPGDIAAAPRHDVLADLVQRQHHILEQSYDALPEEERALLSRIAAYRNPMAYDALVIFNESSDEAKFEAALEDLRARGMLQRDAAHNRYDLHPIVRRYAYDRLTNKTSVHTRLRDYFAKVPVPNEYAVQSIEDLTPIIELYHHTVRAGRYDEAGELFRERLNNLLYYRFGVNQIRIELFRMLFPDGEDHPPRLRNKSVQAQTLNSLANSYSLYGNSRNALRILQVAIPMAEELNEKSNLTIGLGNLAQHQIILGELGGAERNLWHSIELCREIKNEVNEAIGYRELGRVLAYRGAFDEAVRELNTAFGLFAKYGKTQSTGITWGYRAIHAFLAGNAQAAIEAAQQSFEFWKKDAEEVYPVERDLVRVEWLLGMALVMKGKNLSAAATHLTDALTRCRRINLVELEPDILLAWARWHLARGNAQEAHVHAEEALAIADRCEYRLKQAEIHNFLARLAMDVGDQQGAKQHAERARERAWCDGPPYCYKVALEEAEGMLRELGVEESVLSLPPGRGEVYG